jgi:hypothetical protein
MSSYLHRSPLIETHPILGPHGLRPLPCSLFYSSSSSVTVLNSNGMSVGEVESS